MSVFRFIGAIALGMILFPSFTTGKKNFTLKEAIDQKKILVKMTPKGWSNGYGIDLLITNISGGPLHIDPNGGTVFVPADDGAQTLLAVGNEEMALKGGEANTFHITAFCTELHDHSPGDSPVFTLTSTPRTQLMKLANFLDSLNVTDKDMIQHAVWCVSDGAPVYNVSDDADTALTRKVHAYLCSVTGQVDTWYTAKQHVTVNEYQEIVIEPVKVQGEIEFKSDVQVQIQGSITDATGRVLYTNPNHSTAGPGNISFDFELQVQGWKKGTYYIVYTSNGTELLKKEFTI